MLEGYGEEKYINEELVALTQKPNKIKKINL